MRNQIGHPGLRCTATQCRIYQWGDKLSKMLHRLCQMAQSLAEVAVLLDTVGGLFTNPRKVAQAFTDYYSGLYSKREVLSRNQMIEFLRTIQPKLVSDSTRVNSTCRSLKINSLKHCKAYALAKPRDLMGSRASS